MRLEWLSFDTQNVTVPELRDREDAPKSRLVPC
jgi:hypothetical protein